MMFGGSEWCVLGVCGGRGDGGCWICEDVRMCSFVWGEGKNDIESDFIASCSVKL